MKKHFLWKQCSYMCGSVGVQTLWLMKLYFSRQWRETQSPSTIMRKEPLHKGTYHLTIQSHELCKYRTQLRGFWSSPFPACSSFQACASCKFVFVPSRTAHPVGTISTVSTMSDICFYGKNVNSGTHACMQSILFLFFLPGCAGARFDSLLLCISCYRWTCSLSWWAAIQNGGWSVQKSYRGKLKTSR